jgi:hypothetical protein
MNPHLLAFALALAPQDPPPAPAQTGLRATPGVVAAVSGGEPTRDDDSVPLPTKERWSESPQGLVRTAAASGDPYFLGFAAGHYVPPQRERLDPALLAALRSEWSDGRPANETYAFVMFSRRITPSRVAELATLGVRALEFHPHYCLKVALPPSSVDPVAALDYVRWVGVARPWQKFHPRVQAELAALAPGEPLQAWVDVFESDRTPASVEQPVGTLQHGGPDGLATAPPGVGAARRVRTNGWQERALESLGLEVLDWADGIRAFRVRVHPQSLGALAALDFVQFVEPDLPTTPAHDESMPMVNLDFTRQFWDGGVSGAVVAGQADSGIDYAHQGTTGYYWIGSNLSGSVEGTTVDNCTHGSHVNGTIRGNPTVHASFEGGANGLAHSPTTRFFNTKLFYGTGCWSGGATIPQMIDTFDGPFTDGSGFVTPRPHVINNSHGLVGTGFLGTEANCRALDDTVFQYEQLYVFSSGNEGPGAGTVRLEAVAKNVLTVGNVSDRFFAGIGDPGVISTDSSRGPTGDGRWKPNLSAPGREIHSVLAGTGTGYANKSGTSMAAPHVTALAAQVCDREPWFRYNAAPLSAVLMATAVTKDALALDVVGDAATWTHLNTYGAGRIEAWKANLGDAQHGWAVAGFLQGTSGWNSIDVQVNPGARRVVACLVYHEVSASSGASKALVNDLDLWIDAPPLTAGGNSGDYHAGLSSKDNVELRVIDSPSSFGTWRFKANTYAATSTTHAAIAVAVLYGDTLPDMDLSLSASDTIVKPNEAVDLWASVYNPSGLASAVYLDSTGSGSVLLESSTTLFGSVATDLMDNAAAGRDVLLGDIVDGTSRTARWKAYWPSEGYQNWSVEARSDNALLDVASITITVDGTPPSGPGNLASTSHVAGMLSCDSTLDLQWTAASDALSGIAGYSIAVDSSPTTIPPASVNLAGNPTSFSVQVADGPGWWVHLRALDQAGNAGTTAHLGPFPVDADPAFVYCTPKVNSLGCTPQIGYVGTPSFASSSLWIHASQLLNNKNGLLFWGLQPNSAPFQGGTLCVLPPIQREALQNTGGNPPPDDCSGSLSFPWTSAKFAAMGLLPGDTVHSQYWSRDPGSPGGSSLTAAVGFTICR